jgi:hypothetical protein
MGPSGSMDPTQLWQQWYDVGTKMWSDVVNGRQESVVDPYGLYRQWFEGMESARDQMMGTTNGTGGPEASIASLDPREVWRKWFDATAEAWQKSAELGSEMLGMTPRWMQMIEQARNNMMGAQSFTNDPLEFAVQWYNATNGPLSEFVQDVIEREEFLEPSSRFMRNYASLYKVFRRNSEQYLSFLQIPVRSDITRVASLIVGLEDKVDRLEEAFEDFEYGYAEPATAEAVETIERRLGGIERRLDDSAAAEDAASADALSGLANRVDRVEGKIDRVERKLDQLLSAMENVASNGGAAPEADGGAAETSAQPNEEIKATDAARRKAEELGVDLATVQGTGNDGQITVGDVRQKGES